MASPHDVESLGCFNPEQILGMGRTGFVIRQGDLAIKLPLKLDISSDEAVSANIESLQREQCIYQRLEKHDGVVPYLGFSETTTTLRLMKNGDLRSYLKKNHNNHTRPPKHLQLSWFRTMARTLAYIHGQRVIVADIDIASRNFLLDSELSIKICDFTESILLPRETCVGNADVDGYSTRTDIGQLGCVIYEVIAGEKCDFDIFKDIPPEEYGGRWPPRADLPSTHGIWLGSISEKCWTEGAFNTALDLCQELENIGIGNGPDEILSPSSNFNLLSVVQWAMKAYRQHSFCYTTALAITLSAAIYTWTGRRN